MENFPWLPILIAFAGSTLLTTIVLAVLVLRDRQRS